jgi:hypothetical protein
MAMADQCGAFMTAGEYTQLVTRERQAHGRASRRLRLWGSKKLTVSDVMEAVREWEGIATKLEEAGK